MTNPDISSPVKMEYEWIFSVYGQKMMVKSGLEKIFLKSLHPKKILWHIYIMINETLSHKFHPYSILTGEVTVKWLKY